LIGNVDDGIDFEMYLREKVRHDEFQERCERVLKEYGWRLGKYPYRSRIRPYY
jgi:hypothetical protein